MFGKLMLNIKVAIEYMNNYSKVYGEEVSYGEEQ